MPSKIQRRSMSTQATGAVMSATPAQKREFRETVPDRSSMPARSAPRSAVGVASLIPLRLRGRDALR